MTDSSELIESVDNYHERLVVRFLKNFISLENKRILDFGCGTGICTFAMASEGANLTGIDISEGRIQIAKSHYRSSYSQCNIVFMSIEDTTHLPFSDNTFDIVLCNAVFEHILPVQRFSHFSEIARVTKQGGHVVISGTPNRFFPKDSHTSKLWLVPWMPLWLVKPYVILRNGAIKSTDPLARSDISWLRKLTKIPNEEWLRRGIRGVSILDILRWSRKGGQSLEIVNNHSVKELKEYLRNSNTVNKNLKNLIYYGTKSVFLLLNSFGISIHCFLPYINIILIKS